MFIIVACSPSFALLTVMVANWACTHEANLVYFAKISLSPVLLGNLSTDDGDAMDDA